MSLAAGVVSSAIINFFEMSALSFHFDGRKADDDWKAEIAMCAEFRRRKTPRCQFEIQREVRIIGQRPVFAKTAATVTAVSHFGNGGFRNIKEKNDIWALATMYRVPILQHSCPYCIPQNAEEMISASFLPSHEVIFPPLVLVPHRDLHLLALVGVVVQVELLEPPGVESLEDGSGLVALVAQPGT